MKTSIYLLNQRIERILDVVNANASSESKYRSSINEDLNRHRDAINKQAEQIDRIEHNLDVLRKATDEIIDTLKPLSDND